VSGQDNCRRAGMAGANVVSNSGPGQGLTVVAPGMLQNSSVQGWLGGIEPAWRLLDYASFVALHDAPSPTAGPIRLATNLTEEEVQQSAVARNATILLHAAATGPGLQTTAAGNLSRGVVAEMRDLFTWPDFDKAKAFRFQKVINEADFLPLFFVRNLVQAAGLVRKHKAHVETSPAGRRMLERLQLRSLQAMLFHVAFWRLDLSYFGRGLLHGWPQRDAGIVLWSLSVAANDWQPRERLSRLCTVPVIGVLEQKWDIASYALEAHILRPLLWFGLLEYKENAADPGSVEGRHFYRKAPLFDRFLSCDVTLDRTDARRH
jgi:hypothetical protein